MEITEVIEEWKDYICNETLADEIIYQEEEVDDMKEVQVGNYTIKLRIEKVE